jgi:Zn-dependent peptidase ImmA (M78 family)
MEEEVAKANKTFAKKVAQDIIKQAKIKTFPILVKEISKFIPDLFIDGKELEDEISGIQASYKGSYFIRYNANHPVKRNRFTVAHEIGHILLGHTAPCSKSGIESKNLNEI